MQKIMLSHSRGITACTVTGPAVTAVLNLILVTVPAVIPQYFASPTPMQNSSLDLSR